MTPLHVVTEKLKARFSIVKYLVDKGVGINTQDHSGVSTWYTLFDNRLVFLIFRYKGDCTICLLFIKVEFASSSN